MEYYSWLAADIVRRRLPTTGGEAMSAGDIFVTDADKRIAELEAENQQLKQDYAILLDDVRGACGCTGGDDIREHLREYLGG